MMKYLKITVIIFLLVFSSSAHAKGTVENGLYKLYSAQVGPLTEVVQYEFEVRNGLYFEYYDSGEVRNFHHYKDNILNGPSYGYYENGRIFFKRNFKNGQLHGNAVQYYDNGQVKVNLNYNDSMLDGEAKFFNRFGELTKVNIYDRGVLMDTKSF